MNMQKNLSQIHALAYMTCKTLSRRAAAIPPKERRKKMMNLEQMKKNGTVEQDGKEYVLTQEAYRDGEEFTAMAICLQDTADEDGWQTAYRVNWEIIGEDEDESNNADWDNPYSIKEIGKYNMNDGRFY